ncbi:hypothetical protein [Pontibacter sp. G13]|uniref:hypothetical protein n=1 Tax=Pontibacter sp. G13 TaxID=3074898 RepID=UPI0028892639|nr:hypothetical protein [Pontibacter sp. G13]WNJ18319.1 hypothetical protein RJD25_25990 [Pontibacter sp. G13]
MDELITWIYWYCTDFCINMANLLGVSYVEFNMALFLLAFPGLLVILLLLNIWRYGIVPILAKMGRRA